MHIRHTAHGAQRSVRELAPGLREAAGIPNDQLETIRHDADQSGTAGIDLSRPEKKGSHIALMNRCAVEISEITLDLVAQGSDLFLTTK